MVSHPALLVVAGLGLSVSATTAEARATYKIVDDPGTTSVYKDGEADDGRTVLFLNRKGGTYRPGIDNPGRNTSAILERQATIPAWNVDATKWNIVKSCVEGMLSRWDVEVTDVDPGNVPHYEVVIGGRPEDAGMDGGIAGVAPFSSSCRAMPSAVAYTFVELVDSNLRTVCEVTVHEFAHTIGLDHEYLCQDPMSYLRGCGNKSFQPVDAPCGEGSPRECVCGGDTQNSVELLDARLGLAGEGNPAPTVAIASPTDGARVAPGFTVDASALDNGAVDEVQLWIDGDLEATADAAPYTFKTDAKLAPGTHTVEVRAIDGGGAVGRRAVTVLVEDAVKDEISAPVPGGSDEPSSGGCAAGGSAGAPVAAALAALVARLRRSRARR